MKIIRYRAYSGEFLYAQQHSDGTMTQLQGNVTDGFKTSKKKADVGRLLAPITPRAILCIGLNYRQHAAETNAALPNYPVLFFKNPAAVQHPGDPILLPRWMASRKVDYECELAVIIGKRARNVPRAHAYEYVFGYTCANDVSARDWQKDGGGGQWCRGKSFDTFAPLGPCIITRDEIPDPHALRIRTIINGETLQDCSTGDMIFDIPTLIEFLTASTTLLPGTVILTGTPHGVGMARIPARWLKAGDSVSIDIEKIGVLTNPVAEEKAEPGTSFRLV